MLLVARVRRTLLERALVPRGARVVVGTSGGPDSTALLEVLARLAGELSLSLVAAGIDHGLRPSAAAELDLAAAHASRIGVAFERVPVRVDGSVQAGARRARYAALAQLAGRSGASRIAVGHTLDDQAETVLARIGRGSGLRGIAGIDPAREDGVVRPLIDASRADVRAFLDEAGLPFAEDPSNADPRFERARIRQGLLPVLRAADPAALAHLARLADEAREADRALEALAGAALADAASPAGIALDVLRRWPPPVGLRALRQALGEGLGRAHLSILEAWLHGKGERGELRLPGGRTARIGGDHLVVGPPAPSDPDEEA